MYLVGDEVGIVVASCCRTGSHADRPADQDSFAEAHLAVVDGQVPHAAHIGLPGGDILRQDKI